MVADGEPLGRLERDSHGLAVDGVPQHDAPVLEQPPALPVEAAHLGGQVGVDVLGHDLARVTPVREQFPPRERLPRDGIVRRRRRNQLVDGRHATSRSRASLSRCLTAVHP